MSYLPANTYQLEGMTNTGVYHMMYVIVTARCVVVLEKLWLGVGLSSVGAGRKSKAWHCMLRCVYQRHGS